MSITYTNPRLEAVITDWPTGGKRTTATFRIEAKSGKGERATRFTLDPRTGKPSATKVMTFALKARIVDGDDGKTYIIEQSAYEFIAVMRGDMKFSKETLWPRDARFAHVAALFAEPVT